MDIKVSTEDLPQTKVKQKTNLKIISLPITSCPGELHFSSI
jgi:hypothetical protein